MNLGLNGKVALITGGTTGIGLAAALALGAEGARVVVSGRRSYHAGYRRDIEDMAAALLAHDRQGRRSEEHTSELQSLMRISYAVFCLKKKINSIKNDIQTKLKNNATTTSHEQLV